MVRADRCCCFPYGSRFLCRLGCLAGNLRFLTRPSLLGLALAGGNLLRAKWQVCSTRTPPMLGGNVKQGAGTNASRTID